MAPAAASTPSSPVADTTPEQREEGPLALRISEVLADPVEPGVDRAYEWVELVNTSSAVVSTAGWAIGDGSSVDVLPGVEVPPGGYVVVAAEAAVLPVNVLVVRAPDGTIGNGLNNAGDSIRLLSPAGEVVDALSFGDNREVFDSPPTAAGSGATLGARSYEGVGGPERWGVTLRPSPGGTNVLAALPATATPAEQQAPVEAEAAPTPAPVGTTAAVRDATPEAARTPVALPTRFEREPGGATPWIVLGAAAGASIVLVLVALRGAWQAGRGRWRRGG